MGSRLNRHIRFNGASFVVESRGQKNRARRDDPRVRTAYVLLETVMATGLLIVGLAVIGAQVQKSDSAVKKMHLRTRAIMLTEMHLGELDLGLVELDSVDDVQEGDFGPRFPDWGWVLVTEDTNIDEMFLLTLDIMHLRREDDYREDDFDHDGADRIYTAYAMRTVPRPLDFAEDFGLDEERIIELSEKLANLSIPGLDPSAFNPTVLATLDFEEFMEALPVLLEAFGISFDQIASMLPSDILEQIKDSGVFGDDSEGDEE